MADSEKQDSVSNHGWPSATHHRMGSESGFLMETRKWMGRGDSYRQGSGPTRHRRIRLRPRI